MQKPTVLLLYCVEDTSNPKSDPATSFLNADLPKIAECPNVFLHYHSSTRRFPSIQVCIKDKCFHGSEIDHNLTSQGFEHFLKQALTRFPEKKYEMTLVIQSHCWINKVFTYTSKRKTVTYLTSAKLVETIRNNIKHKLKSIIFDCCYMSTIENAKLIAHVSDYMLACQSASPYFGFVSCSRNLGKYIHLHPSQGLPRIVDDCVRYNSKTTNRLTYPTDGAVIYLPRLDVLDEMQISKLKKRYDIDNLKLYDLFQCLDTKPKNINDLVIYYKTSATNRRKFTKGIAVAYKSSVSRKAVL